ncbi:hypothetical protein GQQ29_26445 [Klebsiella pneumoniae]|nr:hypothetical protein [Klebsiella pneumoniae]
MPTALLALPRHTLEVITGNMLGDGSVRYPNFSRDGRITGNARYSMTMSTKAYEYILQLFNSIYSQFSSSGLRPYPNVDLPQHAGKTVTQYHFDTRSLVLFSVLHSL